VSYPDPVTDTLLDPTHHEVRDHLIRGGAVEQFWHSDQRWHSLLKTGQTARAWDRFMGSYPGDTTIQHGLRLLPLPPRTERVPLHRVIGRRVAAHPDIVVESVTGPTMLTPYVYIEGYPRPYPDGRPFVEQHETRAYAFPTKFALSLGHEGTVVVLAGPTETFYDRPADATVQYVNEQRAAGHGISFASDEDRQAVVLRRARALANAKRNGYSEPSLAALRLELERAAARLQ
jgi:hypothetical protein